MAKNKQSLRSTRQSGQSPRITRRADGSTELPDTIVEPAAKVPHEERMLGWIGANRWLLVGMNLAVTVAMMVLAVWALMDGSYGVFLPFGFGLLALRFLIVSLEVALSLQTGLTGKLLKTVVPLIALVCLIIGLTARV
jgi:hypothetical protein